jgi:hypothetical protein
MAVSVLSSPTGGTMTTCNVYSSSYGLSAIAPFSLTYSPPSPATVAGAETSLTTALSSLTSPSETVAGIPLWVLLGAGGLAAILAFR